MLYQFVRPQKLEEIVGNQATVGSLKKIIRQTSSRPHTLLLKGPSGCGKTTIARILAKEFGSTEDTIFELNAANTRGIDTVREISEKAYLQGFGGAAKTYILDESQQITKTAQEALLKIIEDNPPHCYFIFCTTEPQNIIKTVRNRCAEYEVSLLSKNEIVEVLNSACKKKKLTVDKEIIEAISLTCEGSPRAALVSLEQVSEVEDVGEALELLVRGSEKDSNVIELYKLLVMAPEIRQKKWKQIITTFAAIDEDSEKVRRALLTLLFNRLKECNDIEEAKDISRLLSIFSASTFYGGKSQLAALIVKCLF